MRVVVARTFRTGFGTALTTGFGFRFLDGSFLVGAFLAATLLLPLFSWLLLLYA